MPGEIKMTASSVVGIPVILRSLIGRWAAQTIITIKRYGITLGIAESSLCWGRSVKVIVHTTKCLGAWVPKLALHYGLRAWRSHWKYVKMEKGPALGMACFNTLHFQSWYVSFLAASRLTKSTECNGDQRCLVCICVSTCQSISQISQLGCSVDRQAHVTTVVGCTLVFVTFQTFNIIYWMVLHPDICAGMTQSWGQSVGNE